jgi:hypothetical protein
MQIVQMQLNMYVMTAIGTLIEKVLVTIAGIQHDM